MKNGKIKKYNQLSSKYLGVAEDLLKKDDLSQASEKLWGSFAVIIKAVAAKRKKIIRSHDGISLF